MSVCSECWTKFRSTLHWNDGDDRATFVQFLVGGVLGFLAVRLFKYVAMLAGLLIVGTEVLRRHGMLGTDLEWVYSEMGTRMQPVMSQLNEVLSAPENRAFMAGLMVGASSNMR